MKKLPNPNLPNASTQRAYDQLLSVKLNELLNSFRHTINMLITRTDIPVYANNAAAIAGGLAVGDYYRTGADPDPVCIVH